MAPISVDASIPVNGSSGKAACSRNPLKPSGALDSFESFDPTPATGREFPHANIVEWLKAPNSEELIRDLAITSTLILRVFDSWIVPMLTVLL